ncbi:hypothetical protein AX15_006935, partial [Amanita polypyramis BW_CC]
MRLTHGLAYVNRIFLEDLDLIVLELIGHVFKAWCPLFGKVTFYASNYDGIASRMRSKVRIMSNPPTPPPRVSQDGLPEIPRGRSNIGQKPIGKVYLVKDGSLLQETTSYLQSTTIPDVFKNPEPAISLPKAVVPDQLRVQDNDYYESLVSSIAPPSQDNIEEHQTFLATIYQVIEAKLVEEEGIFVASDTEIRDQKWSPLAPKADIPSANIISQEWAQEHTHSEFLREQARLNSFAAGQWRVLWTANPPDRHSVPEYYKTWSQLDNYCRQVTQTWYNIRFKELKEDTAEALDLDPITFKEIKTSTEWLADDLEAVGKNPAYAAQQAVLRAESVASSRAPSRIQSLVIMAKPKPSIHTPSPKARSRSADAVMRHSPTPDNEVSRTPTPRQSKETSEITSLKYIDETHVKQESPSPHTEEISMVIVNAAPIRHRTDMVIDESAQP